MSAHKSKQTTGHFKCVDGNILTERDTKGNVEADRLAILALKQHKVDAVEVKDWNDKCASATSTAMWIAIQTWAASNCEDEPYKDSEASSLRADLHWKEKEDQHKKAKLKLGRPIERSGRAEDLRGHSHE